ncbi:hypothetical protein [Salipiger mucosus]|uniref:Uncharacterized protein n=1 Tax=Salipiger mucosus DSM 16094 TaxID=1123237 RepID=S9QDS7_9RHOB|nr:hypothetical protein [Salipiger mucosus]EPX78057.1 hypothetical protein Salmuc_03379 [Salipiger mucosus DSM 16094]
MKANDLRTLATDWLAAAYPDSILVTELSIDDWGSASLDLAAITPSHIVGVEIKGEGDSPARLERQALTYPMAAREMWLLCDPSIKDKCFAKRPAGWGRLELWEGKVRPDNRAKKRGPMTKRKNGNHFWPSVRDDSRYVPDRASKLMQLAPHAICGALWKDELLTIARKYDLLPPRRKAYVHVLTEILIDNLPVTVIHDEMIAAFRCRQWRKTVLDLRGRQKGS